MGFSDFPFQSRFIKIGDHDIHYVDQGSGHVLVFLHGHNSFTYSWRNVIDVLRDRYRCIALDLPGFGYTQTSADRPLDIDQQISVIESLLDQLELERVTLIGHDWGGLFATHLAAKLGDRVAGLCLLESFPFYIEPNELSPPVRGLLALANKPKLAPWLFDRQPFMAHVLQYLALPRRLPASVRAAYRARISSTLSRRVQRYWLTRLPIKREADAPASPTAKWLDDTIHSFTGLTLPILALQCTPGFFFNPSRIDWLRQQGIGQLIIKDCGQGRHLIMESSPIAISLALKQWLPDVTATLRQRPAINLESDTVNAPNASFSTPQTKVAKVTEKYRGPLSWSFSRNWQGMPTFAAWSDYGLVHLSLVNTEEQGLEELSARFPLSSINKGDIDIKSALSKAVSLHLVGTAFQTRTWQALLDIPSGETRHYGQLAQALGTQARAIGQAVGKNRIAVLVPCHRVVRADGEPGGFYWGLERKTWLLEQEKPA